MPLLLVSYAVREMFLVKITRPSPRYDCKKTHPILARVLLQLREHVRCYVRQQAWPNISVLRVSCNHSKADFE